MNTICVFIWREMQASPFTTDDYPGTSTPGNDWLIFWGRFIWNTAVFKLRNPAQSSVVPKLLRDTDTDWDSIGKHRLQFSSSLPVWGMWSWKGTRATHTVTSLSLCYSLSGHRFNVQMEWHYTFRSFWYLKCPLSLRNEIKDERKRRWAGGEKEERGKVCM